MARKLEDDDLTVILNKALANSEHLTDSRLSREREEVRDYYSGELPKPLHRGDSKYVSRDVFDAVDSMRSTILESFSANTRIVTFRPELGETTDDAKQATEYTRHAFFKDNPGEDILYEVLTDGLMCRMGVVKVFYDGSETTEEYEFENLTEDELTIEVGQHDNYEFVELSMEGGLYSGIYSVLKTCKKVVVETIQPEDFLISNSARSICEAKYVIHRATKTRSWLVKRYGEEKVEKINFTATDPHVFDYEKQGRFQSLDMFQSAYDSYDESVEEAVLYEFYIKLDMDGTGVAKLWKVDFCGGEVLAKEQVSRAPFASFVPLPIPHTFIGDNFAKSVIPVQNARTVLIRQIINHSLITNNPRQMVLNGTLANPTELVENRLGGIVNVRRMDGIAPIPQAPLNPFIFNLIQMIDEDKEETTGISKLSQGMNKDAISTQNAQGMVEQLISASQQRTKIIARRFGLFLRELWHLIYHTAVDHIDEETFIEVTGSYVPVVPAQWKQRTAANVELTLGYGEQEREAMKWIEIDAAMSQDPELKQLYSLENRYEVVRRAMEFRGIEDIDAILKHPSQLEPPPPNPAQEMQLKQLEAQIAYTQAQTQAMLSKAETDKIKAETERMKVMAAAQAANNKLQLEAVRVENELWVDQREIELAAKAPEQAAVYNPS